MSEIQAKIEALDSIKKLCEQLSKNPSANDLETIISACEADISLLKRSAKTFSFEKETFNNVIKNITRSHKALCAVKNMGEKDAYGQDPIMYYTLAINGECGELANKIVKGHRNGYSYENALEAVKSEIQDIFIYTVVLAYVLDLDLAQLVNDKVEIIIQRAESGYYGGSIQPKIS